MTELNTTTRVLTSYHHFLAFHCKHVNLFLFRLTNRFCETSLIHIPLPKFDDKNTVSQNFPIGIYPSRKYFECLTQNIPFYTQIRKSSFLVL